MAATTPRLPLVLPVGKIISYLTLTLGALYAGLLIAAVYQCACGLTKPVYSRDISCLQLILLKFFGNSTDIIFAAYLQFDIVEMFSATAHQVVKSLGKDSLIPVQSIDVSDNIKPLAILLTERRRRFFWRRTRYLTTEFCLDDILDEALCKDGANKDEIVRSRELAKFDFETNFSLSGKLGIDLQKEFLDFELDASDNATVKSELGELRKEEVNLPAFLSLTKER